MAMISGGRNPLFAPTVPGVSGAFGFCEGCSGVVDVLLPSSAPPSGLDVPTMRFMASRGLPVRQWRWKIKPGTSTQTEGGGSKKVNKSQGRRGRLVCVGPLCGSQTTWSRCESFSLKFSPFKVKTLQFVLSRPSPLKGRGSGARGGPWTTAAVPRTPPVASFPFRPSGLPCGQRMGKKSQPAEVAHSPGLDFLPSTFKPTARNLQTSSLAN
jgi:hypothetical protein